MQQKATQFIDLLERKQLLAPEIVEELRRQVAEAKTRLTPELLAKLLVDNGHLTKFQATKLIAEAKELSDALPEEAVAPQPAAPSTGSTGTPGDADELGFAPDPEGEIAEESVVDLEEEPPVAAVFIDEEDAGTPEVDATAVAVEAVEVEAVVPVEAAVPVEVEPIAVGSDAFAATPPRPVRPVTKKMQQTSPWESYRILGRGVVLALLMIALVVLVLYFWRGSAEDHLRRADDLYESRGYETAAGLYEEFYERWPTHEKASYAKVRSVLATLRGATELAPDPLIGLEKVLELVPGLAGEPGLPEQQSDLAGVLISLAEKFNERADNTKETEKRKKLMQEMEKLLELINNPQFVGPTQRSQQAPTLQRIAEDRQRILREINRDEELMQALAEMDKLLDAKDTLAAYQVREALIDRYPLLEAHPEVIRRVQRATEILQSLVQSASLEMQRSDAPPAMGPRQVTALTHHRGREIPALAEEVLFYKAGGAVYGLDGTTGAVRWRHFVGRGLADPPVRIGKGAAADALIFVSRSGQLTRVDGRTGQPEWYVDLGTEVLPPTVESDDVFVATTDGRIANLDAVSGQARWIRQLPQPVEVSPGTALAKPHLYVLGEHSNLYVLSRRDGTCTQVVYTGHRKGAISVPPVLLLGQLFLFENITPEAGKIRILSASDEGVGLEDAQLPIPVDGNVVLPPTIAGRRMIVHSDLGQILVLDIEPTEEKDKVIVAAKIPKNVFTPQLAWSVFDNNVLWVADRRFTRFNYQVSLGKLDRAWIKDDGDLFVAAPMKFGDWIVHARRMRGSQGIRVAAVDAEKGDPAWETDLAVPVSWIGPEADGWDAITSAAMLFRSPDGPLVASADVDAGRGKPQLAMRDPVTLAGGGVVLVNASRSNQIARYQPGPRPDLQLLLANLGSARPTCPPVAVEDLIALGLNNGQFVLVDPSNGSQPVTPYQPPMEPGKTIVWNRPVYLPGSQTLIVANSLQKLVRLSTDGALRPLTEVDLESPFDGPLAASGARVFGVVASPRGDSIEAYDVVSLEKQGGLALTGRRVAGPFSVPGGVLVQTSTHLVAVGQDCQELWKTPAPEQPLSGGPVDIEGTWVLASRDGRLWKIDPDSGRVLATYDAMQGVAAPLTSRGSDLLLGSDEGAVLTVPLSDFEEQ